MKLVDKDEAIKRLKKIGSADKTKSKKKILGLLSNPYMGKPLKGKLHGLYSLKAWPLRIIYTYDPDRQIIQIEDIDYRGDVYKN